MQTLSPKEIYLSIEKFNNELEYCLTIIKEPTKTNKYYVCEYISAGLYKSIVHIYITN